MVLSEDTQQINIISHFKGHVLLPENLRWDFQRAQVGLAGKQEFRLPGEKNSFQLCFVPTWKEHEMFKKFGRKKTREQEMSPQQPGGFSTHLGHGRVMLKSQLWLSQGMDTDLGSAQTTKL